MATEAIVSVVLEQLISIIGREIHQEVRQVVGVRKEIKKLTSSFQALQAVLLDAEERQVKDKVVGDWLDKLKDVSYDMDDVLDEWNTAILKLQIEGVGDALIAKKKVCGFFPSPRFCFEKVSLRRDIAIKIKEVNENLDSVYKEKDMYNLNIVRSIEEPQRLKTTSFVDVSDIHGRDKEKNHLIHKLLTESNGEGKGLHIISIVGMGGIGKTTFAQLVYNDGKIISKFKKRIWVCVSDPFDEVRIAKAIIEVLRGQATHLVEFQALLECICESIEGKKFLLVLDDVWEEDYNKWGPLYNSLNNGLHGSKILITTRKNKVAHMMKSIDIINIGELSGEESWSLFKGLAFCNRSHEEYVKLETIGREIVGKCKGLPLALITVGSLLRFKRTREQWKRIVDSEMWQLEELEKGLFPPLLLSYKDLSSMEKRCFSYCAIFPKDYTMKKEELIKLWMAQGYLGLEQNKEMEIIGEECFENLVMHSFFQDFQKDSDGSVIACKMHDIVHDFAQFLIKRECFTLEISSLEEPSPNSYEKVRHLMLILGNKDTSFPANICNVQQLRSLLVAFNSSSVCNVLPKLFEQLTCLRALDISIAGRYITSIKEIPGEIQKLIHLRYLNMSKLENLEELPESLCDLYNLQILDISYCLKLKKLPQGMGKLINLRHLINDVTAELCYMPKGIERLTCLHTLRKLVLGSRLHGSEACTLECLKNLYHLKGSLELTELEIATNEAEAKQAELSKKENLIRLSLSFGGDIVFVNNEEFPVNDEELIFFYNELLKHDEVILEALEPPPNLENLSLSWYRGNIFPNWMVSLSQLKKLYLSDCIKCEHLPPLGILPSLDSLGIFVLGSVKRVGNEFLGIEHISSRSSSSLVLFPKLKNLSFHFMEVWEDWEYVDVTRDITIMPSLSSLSFYDCPKLKALPDHLLQTTSLKKLFIHFCPILDQRYRVEKGRDWPRISHIPDIKFDGIAVKLEGDRRRCYPYTSGLLKHAPKFTYVILEPVSRGT